MEDSIFFNRAATLGAPPLQQVHTGLGPLSPFTGEPLVYPPDAALCGGCRESGLEAVRKPRLVCSG